MWNKNEKPWYWFSLVGVISVLAIIILPKYFKQSSSKNLFAQEINKFEIGKLNFVNEGGMWFFVDESGIEQLANQENVTLFLNTGKNIRLEKVAAVEISSLEALGIKEQNQLKVGNDTYWIGKLGPNYDTTFIRPVDGPRSYEINTVWGNLEIFKSNYWVNKYATNFPVFQISKVEMQNKTLEPKDGKWDNQKFIETLAYLKNGKYIGTEKPKSKSEFKFKIYLESEIKEVLIGDYWVKYGNFYYEISKNDFEVLTSVVK